MDVVIVGYKSASGVQKAVESINRSTDVVTRVLIVDNSAEKSIRTVADTTASALIVPDTNLGFGGACNLGLTNTSEEWVAFANQDVEVTSDAIRVLVAAVEQHEESYGRTAVAGPLLVNAEGLTSDGGHRFPTPFRQVVEMIFGERIAGARRTASENSGPVVCGWIPAAFIVGRRKAFELVSGFDPTYFMYVEDVDLFSRLSGKDVDCLWVPGALVRHAGGRRPISPQLYGRAVENWSKYFSVRHGKTAGRAVLVAGIVGSLVRSILWAYRERMTGAVDGQGYAKMFGRGAVVASRGLMKRPRRDFKAPK